MTARRRMLIAGAVGLAAVIGLLAWALTRPSTARACSLAGWVGAPTADTAEAAFDAWWEAQGEEHTRSFDTDDPTRDDFDRDGEGEWVWRYGDDEGVLVTVGQRDDGWTVVGVNHCNYGVAIG